MVNTSLHIQQQPILVHLQTPRNQWLIQLYTSSNNPCLVHPQTPQQPMVNTTLHIQQQPMFSTPPNPPATNG